MEFELTEEQVMMRENARRFLEKEVAPHVHEWDRQGVMTRDTALSWMQRLKPLGYIGTIVPEEQGGFGLDRISYAILMEELRKTWASLGGVIGICTSMAGSLSRLGTEEQRKKYLKPLLEGKIIGCSGITEPNVGSDVSSIQTGAVKDRDAWVINGTKMWISNGSISDFIIVICRTSQEKGYKGFSRILVDRSVSPYNTREIPKIGLKAFPTSEVVFEDCRVPLDNIIGEEGAGFEGAMEALVSARLNAAVGAVGIMQAAIDKTVAYAKERPQFGKPIGSYQLMQAKIAEMEALCDASRLLVYRGLWRLDKGLPCTKESSIAKYFATEAAVQVTGMAIQVHGAYGLSEEYPVERLYRDARCYTIPDGTTEIHKLIIGREMLGIKAFR
jgi:alkylation response protein AidB-like acyl-CoA dehydrogenase